MTSPGEGSLPEAGRRERVRLLSPAIHNLAQSQSPILVHLDIGEGVCVQVVGDGMADPPLLVAQAGEVKVEPGADRWKLKDGDTCARPCCLPGGTSCEHKCWSGRAGNQLGKPPVFGLVMLG